MKGVTMQFDLHLLKHKPTFLLFEEQIYFKMMYFMWINQKCILKFCICLLFCIKEISIMCEYFFISSTLLHYME